MNTITVRSPTRVDLAGGTLDCWPLYLFLDNPVTVNVAISIFTTVILRPRPDARVRILTRDLGVDREYESLEVCLRDREPAFDLVRVHLKYWQPMVKNRGFELEMASESPIGGGLGGSSSLCVSLLKAFSRWLEKPFSELGLVRLASHLEAQVLLKPTGTQDYFPPLDGQLCFIRYGVEGPRCERLPIDDEIFRDRFVLVYTGRSHHSGINNWQVIKDWLDGDERTRRAMQDLARISKSVQVVLQAGANDQTSGAIDELPRLFAEEYEARTRLSEGFSSPEIKRLHEIARADGAVAKICGAGGGGCVMLWSHDRRADALAESVRKNGFQVLNAYPWEPST